MFCDKAMFHISGHVNHHNCQIQGAENPHVVQGCIHDSSKVTVVDSHLIVSLGHLSLWKTQLMDKFTWICYKTLPSSVMLKNFLLPRLVENDPINTIIFHQAGTLLHFSRHLTLVLSVFLRRWTGRGGSILLPSDTT
jgi:hypothetical protein